MSGAATTLPQGVGSPQAVPIEARSRHRRNRLAGAVGAGATFITRGIDIDQKGLRLNPKTLQLEAIQVGAEGVDEVLVHDKTNSTLALMLLNLAPRCPPPSA